MRFLFVTIIQLLISTFAGGQSTFWAEGKEYKTGTIEKSYDFGYSFGDTVTLSLFDSVCVYTDVKKTMVKTEKNFHAGEQSSKRCIIEYNNSKGLDSLRREYENDELVLVYDWQYDSLLREVSYRTYYSSNRVYDVLNYLYSDSVTKDGKASVRTLYANGYFYMRYLQYHDEKNRMVKEVRERYVDDPTPYIITYTYDDQDSLISEKHNGTESLLRKIQHLPKLFSLQNVIKEYEFPAIDYWSVRNLALRLLNENIEYLENYNHQNALEFISPDKQTTLTIRQMETWCISRTLNYTTVQKY